MRPSVGASVTARSAAVVTTIARQTLRGKGAASSLLRLGVQSSLQGAFIVRGTRFSLTTYKESRAR